MEFNENTHDQINEQVAQPEQQQESQPESQQESQAPQAESHNAKNIRLLREKAERAEKAERERDELAKLLKQHMEKQSPAPVEQDEDDFNLSIGDDDLAEGKHLSKMAKEIKSLKKQLKGYQQQSNESMAESKLKAQFPDFEKVVSMDNVRALSAAYPELAATLNSTPDLYNKAVSTYHMIKRMGLMPQEDVYSADREIAQKNAQKPRPLASVSPQQGDSPMSKANAFANGLTDDLRKQLYKEMMDSMKNA